MAFALRRVARALVFAWISLYATSLFSAERYVLPPPTGKLAVGRSDFYIVDTSRTDPSGTHPEHKREFWVEVWYPAELSTGTLPAPWLPPEWVPLEAEGLLGMQLGRSADPAAKDVAGVLRAVVTHAVERAAIAKAPQRFPVLIFSPGNFMFPTEYSSLLEEMASQGYIVIANVPTGFVAGVAFPDGRVTRRDPKADFTLWKGDIEYMIDQAVAWNGNRGSQFFGRMDLERIGIFGHSAGANIAAMLAHSDPRIKAGLALDPGIVRVSDAGGPFMMINAENADFLRRHGDDPDIKGMVQERIAFYHAGKPGIQVTLAGTDHNSFTDMAVIKAFDRPGDGSSFIATTRAFVREFFGEFLQGKSSDVIRKGSPLYPVAKVESAGWPDGSSVSH